MSSDLIPVDFKAYFFSKFGKGIMIYNVISHTTKVQNLNIAELGLTILLPQVGDGFHEVVVVQSLYFFLLLIFTRQSCEQQSIFFPAVSKKISVHN